MLKMNLFQNGRKFREYRYASEDTFDYNDI